MASLDRRTLVELIRHTWGQQHQVGKERAKMDAPYHAISPLESGHPRPDIHHFSSDVPADNRRVFCEEGTYIER